MRTVAEGNGDIGKGNGPSRTYLGGPIVIDASYDVNRIDYQAGAWHMHPAVLASMENGVNGSITLIQSVIEQCAKVVDSHARIYEAYTKSLRPGNSLREMEGHRNTCASLAAAIRKMKGNV